MGININKRVKYFYNENYRKKLEIIDGKTTLIHEQTELIWLISSYYQELSIFSVQLRQNTNGILIMKKQHSINTTTHMYTNNIEDTKTCTVIATRFFCQRDK